jgi:MFS family permease
MPGAFVLSALLTQWYGFEKAVYGFLVSLPFLANSAQTLALPLLAGRTSPKRLTLVMAWINLLFWFGLVAALPFLPRTGSTLVVVLFTVFFTLASLSGAFSSVGWIAWLRDWIPGRLRGGYLGRRNSMIAAITLIFLGLVMAIFKILPHSIWPFVWILGFAATLRFFGLLTLHTIHAPRPAAAIESLGFSAVIRECLHAPGLVLFILFSTWTNFWMGFSSPFGPVFCFEELGLGPDDFAFLTALSTVSAVAGWTFWGRVADRAGNIPVLVFGMLVWESSNVLWAALNPANSWLLYPMFLWGGFFSVAYFLSSFNLLLNLVPQKSTMAAISIYLGVTSAAMGVAPILAGALLEEFLVQRGLGIMVYHSGFFLKAAATLLGLLLLYTVREPGRTRHESLPAALRSLTRIMTTQAMELLKKLPGAR